MFVTTYDDITGKGSFLRTGRYSYLHVQVARAAPASLHHPRSKAPADWAAKMRAYVRTPCLYTRVVHIKYARGPSLILKIRFCPQNQTRQLVTVAQLDPVRANTTI